MKQAFPNSNRLGFNQSQALLFLVGLMAGIIMLLIPVYGNAQITKIIGQVIDTQTNEPVPFANVLVLSTLQGTLTDFQGKYTIELKGTDSDSLRASLLGYRKITKPIVIGQFQTINFELTRKDQDLPEVIITYKGNPADALIDSIIKYKKRNTFQSFQTYQYNSYTKIQLDANNVTERIINRKILKPFKFVLDYVDTSTISGKSYLPVMITETNSVIYKRKSPKTKKEIIMASRISGIEDANISQYLGKLTQHVDIYSNFTDLFEKNFVSPIADFGHDFYKYYLIDSAYIREKWCYHIMFKPKRKQELTYTGGLWVNDTSFAVVSIQMRIAEDANINLVNYLGVEQQFSKIDGYLWMKTKDKLFADFNPMEHAKKVIGVYGQKTNIYSNFKFDSLENSQVFKLPVDITVLDDANQIEDSYWDTIRPESLSEREQGIYTMIDSIKNTPIFKRYRDVSYGLASGYFPWGKFEVGPYFKLFSYNTLEGARFRIGGRTSTKFSKKLKLEAYIAYGTKDQRFKYGGKLLYLPNKNPRRSLFVSYKYDMEQIGMSSTARATDNVFSSIFSRGPIDKLTMVREYIIAYEYEWFNGLINIVEANRRELFPLGETKFIIYPDSRNDTVYASSITTTEIGLDTRISFKETYINGKFKRLTIKSEYPIISIRYRYGIPLAHNYDYTYHKLNIGIEQWFGMGTIGWSRFKIDAGKIWGTLPYPLLKIHEGNETWLYDKNSSNMMNYYEFASDQYINLFYTHHFDGFFFNKIPGVRKLKWREVIYFRGLYGTLSEKNLSFSQFPGNLRSLGKEPYLETGAGIENIFQVLRVFAIWRLTHLNDYGSESVTKFGIFASVYFSF